MYRKTQKFHKLLMMGWVWKQTQVTYSVCSFLIARMQDRGMIQV